KKPVVDDDFSDRNQFVVHVPQPYFAPQVYQPTYPPMMQQPPAWTAATQQQYGGPAPFPGNQQYASHTPMSRQSSSGASWNPTANTYVPNGFRHPEAGPGNS